jgi:hypothetical protein
MTDKAALALPDSFSDNLPDSIPPKLEFFLWGGSLDGCATVTLYEIVRTRSSNGFEKRQAVKVDLEALTQNNNLKVNGGQLRPQKKRVDKQLWFEESILDHLHQ